MRRKFKLCNDFLNFLIEHCINLIKLYKIQVLYNLFYKYPITDSSANQYEEVSIWEYYFKRLYFNCKPLM